MNSPLRLLKYYLAGAALMVCAGFIHADWALSNADSSIHFVSVKNTSIAEIHTFKKLSGNINKNGQASLDIDLDSVHTLIPIRDERMRKMLFETNLYPTALLTTKVDMKSVKQLAPGDSKTMPLTFTLDLHGEKTTTKATVNVVALRSGGIQVNTISPLILKVDDYKLVKGVNALREVAGLSSISSSVLVSAQLVFTK